MKAKNLTINEMIAQIITEARNLGYQRLVEVDNLLRDNSPKPPVNSELFISRSRKRLGELTPQDCNDAECFALNGRLIWNGF